MVVPPDDGLSVCNVTDYGRMPAEANARLIAAAPDLLEACQRAIGYLENAGDNISYAVELGGDVHEDAMQQNIKTGIQELEAAIAKAEGH